MNGRPKIGQPNKSYRTKNVSKVWIADLLYAVVHIYDSGQMHLLKIGFSHITPANLNRSGQRFTDVTYVG